VNAARAAAGESVAAAAAGVAALFKGQTEA
jgi:hypothetical protein